MEKVKFLLKRNKNREKLVHSICRTASGEKSVFPREFRNPNCHSEGVKNKVQSFDFAAKSHMDYVLKGDEVWMYLNPTNQKFWFCGKELSNVPASAVSKQPSEENQDESQNLPSTSRGIVQKPKKGVKRQSAVNRRTPF